MFIHWGPVSLTGEEISWSRDTKTPINVYDNLYRRFNPTKFDADRWVSAAKAAGMKYIVLTAKHHDGFCLWDTKQTDYNIMHSPFARDVVKELAEACKKQGMAFGVYYSICDWHHLDYPEGSPYDWAKPNPNNSKPNPNMDRYVRFIKAQLKELLESYGPMVVVWFDGEWEKPWTLARGKDLYAYLHTLQPDLIINNRVGKNRDGRSTGGEVIGDYDTPEQEIGAYQVRRPWESSITLCKQWAWKPNDQMKGLKECLQTLVRCAGGDGNLSFNVGPMPSGEIEPRQVQRLKEMGAWLAKYGESIYGTRGGPWEPGKGYVSTQRNDAIYLHVLAWEGDSVKLPPLAGRIAKAEVLTGGAVEMKQDAAGIVLSVPAADRREIDTIVRLKQDRPAR